MLCLSLAGNNDAGNWRNEIDAATIASLHLSGDDVPCKLIGGRRLLFGKDLIILTYRYIPWHGNMAWDSFQVTPADAVRVIEFLRSQHWDCEEGEADLFRAYEDGKPITETLLENAESFFEM
jgi:hypothetical protein